MGTVTFFRNLEKVQDTEGPAYIKIDRWIPRLTKNPKQASSLKEVGKNFLYIIHQNYFYCPDNHFTQSQVQIMANAYEKFHQSVKKIEIGDFRKSEKVIERLKLYCLLYEKPKKRVRFDDAPQITTFSFDSPPDKINFDTKTNLKKPTLEELEKNSNLVNETTVSLCLFKEIEQFLNFPKKIHQINDAIDLLTTKGQNLEHSEAVTKSKKLIEAMNERIDEFKVKCELLEKLEYKIKINWSRTLKKCVKKAKTNQELLKHLETGCLAQPFFVKFDSIPIALSNNAHFQLIEEVLRTTIFDMTDQLNEEEINKENAIEFLKENIYLKINTTNNAPSEEEEFINIFNRKVEDTPNLSDLEIDLVKAVFHIFLIENTQSIQVLNHLITQAASNYTETHSKFGILALRKPNFE